MLHWLAEFEILLALGMVSGIPGSEILVHPGAMCYSRLFTGAE